MRIRRRFARGIAVLLALLTLTIAGMAQAQGTALSYGTAATGTITTEAPFSFYSFGGTTGDQVTVRVISLQPGFVPTVSINSPTGQQIVFSSSDFTSPAPGTARADVRLPQDGTFTIQVGSLNAAPGDFLIRLDGTRTDGALALSTTASGPVPVTFIAAQPNAVLSLPQIPDGPATLTLTGSSDSVYSAAIFDADGMLVGFITPDENGFGSASMPAGDGEYIAVVRNLDGADFSVDARLLAGAASSAGAPTGSDAPAAPTSAPSTGSGACTITTGPNGTNLRGGPGTNYNVIVTLPGDATYGVTGANGDWYTINYDGQQGWLAGSVTTLEGNCSAVTFVQAPPAPTASAPDPATEPTPTTGGPTPTASPTTEPGQPTAPAQPTIPPTPTTAAQVAPPDNSYIYNADRDNGGSFSEVISYPDGDSVDQVEIRLNLGSNQSRNVSVTLACAGTGTQDVSFTRSSTNAQRYACGDTITYRYYQEFGSQRYYVFSDSGGPVYVNYTLVITTAP